MAKVTLKRCFCVFEYLYRDAGNFKSCEKVLLRGKLHSNDLDLIKQKLESGEFFIPEAVDLEALQCRLGMASLNDHVWHEFVDLRPATDDEIETMHCFGNKNALIKSFTGIENWEISSSKLFAAIS